MLDKAIMSHWGWENIGRGLDATSAAEMHTSFWRSDILVELYRDTVYAAAGAASSFVIVRACTQDSGLRSSPVWTRPQANKPHLYI